MFQKQVCERDRFFQRATTVAAKIDNEPRDVFLLQALEQCGDVARRAFGMPVHVGVERGQREPAKFHGVAVLVLLNDDVRPRFLVFQFNFIAHQLDVLALRWIGRIHRNDQQANPRAFFAADHLHDFVQPHVTYIDILILSLRDGSDPVAHL